MNGPTKFMRTMTKIITTKKVIYFLYRFYHSDSFFLVIGVVNIAGTHRMRNARVPDLVRECCPRLVVGTAPSAAARR